MGRRYAVFFAKTHAAAQTEIAGAKGRDHKSDSDAVTCLRNDIDDCLTYFDFPKPMRTHIRTTNALEGLFHTVRLRTDSMGVFQNEQSCLTIVYATI